MKLSEDALDHAYEIAERVGHAIRTARLSANGGRGESQPAVARAVGTHFNELGRMERGQSPNVKIGNIARFLARYDLTLVVVPRGTGQRMDGARRRLMQHERECGRDMHPGTFGSPARRAD